MRENIWGWTLKYFDKRKKRDTFPLRMQKICDAEGNEKDYKSVIPQTEKN